MEMNMKINKEVNEEAKMDPNVELAAKIGS